MTPSELKEFLFSHQLTVDYFAKRIGLTDQAVDSWLKGTRKIPAPVVELIKIFKNHPEVIDE